MLLIINKFNLTMSDTKQILRVVLKLMAGFALAWLVFIFVSGLLVGQQAAESGPHSFDLGKMQPGEVKYFQLGRRKLLVTYSKDYYVAWADDPVYGCALEYLPAEQRFKSICVDSWFDLQGQPLAGSKTELDLKRPDYRITPQLILLIDLL